MLLLSVLLLVIVLHLFCRSRQGQNSTVEEQCRRCGKTVAADDLLCNGCHTLLQNHCPTCGRAKGAEHHFCPWCGAEQFMEQHHA